MNNKNKIISIILIVLFFLLLMIPLIKIKSNKEVLDDKEDISKEVEKDIKEPVQDIVIDDDKKEEKEQVKEEEIIKEDKKENTIVSKENNSKKKETVKKPNNNINNNQTNSDNNISNYNQNNNSSITQPSVVEDNKKEETVSNNTTNNSNNNNTNNNVPVEPVVPPVITYTCPEGYVLNGTKCTSTISSNYVCPPNTHDYGSADIPRDTYCINLSEGYEIDTDSCPSGYGILAIIGFGVPDKYKCFPLHNKIYVCDDGYQLNGTSCIKEIDASIE